MAISDNYAPDISLGNGVTTQFSGNWKVLNADYFKAALQSVATGIQTPLNQGSDYTLVFDDDGYEITLAVAPTSANYVVRYREVALDQTDPYRTSKGFQGKVIEDSFDKLTAIDQDQQDQIDRSLKFQVGSSAAGYTIEDPIDGRSLKWDVPNNRIINSESDVDEVVAEVTELRDETLVARDAAVAAQGGAEDAETNAEDWATKINGDVDGSGEYSSKAYAIGGTGVTNTAGKGAAKEWATKAHGATVDGTEFSAKHYSVESANYAAAAASSAAEGLYNDVITITAAQSPYVPTVAQEGTLFRLDMTAGAIVVNLSALSVYNEDMKFGFVKVDATGNSATINRGGTDTINGANSASIGIQFETHVLVGDLQTGTWIDTVQATGIPNGTVTNARLANMPALTVKANATNASAAPQDIALGASQLFGCNQAGTALAAIGLGAGLAITGTTLNTVSQSVSQITQQIFTSSGTWNKPAGLLYAVVEVVGGGGGGGNAVNYSGGSVGGGGSGGGYSRKLIAAGTLGASETVTIGGGGGTAAAGGTSSFGAHCSASGGGGGGVGPGAGFAVAGAAGVGSGGDINLRGGVGDNAYKDSVNNSGGRGGSSAFAGMNTARGTNGAGIAGLANTGQGGSGGFTTSGAQGGSSGGSGIVIVTEFCQ